MDEQWGEGKGGTNRVVLPTILSNYSCNTHKNNGRNKLGICTEITLCKLSHKPTADGRVDDKVKQVLKLTNDKA